MDQPAVERRTQLLRRDLNQSFRSPDGRFSASKTIAVFAQIAVLYHTGMHFETLMLHWDSLVVILAFLIAPDTVKKLIVLKYGNGK